MKFLSNIPFVAPLTSYPWKAHSRSLQKFWALWILSILPLLFAALMKKPIPNSPWWGFVGASLLDQFRASNLFVYSISFLVPMLYLIYERFDQLKPYAFSRKTAPKQLDTPRQIGVVILMSAVVFLFTAFAFRSDPLHNSNLISQLGEQLVWFIYVFAMYCWYLTIIMEKVAMSGDDFVAKNRTGEQELSQGLRQRVHEEDANGE